MLRVKISWQHPVFEQNQSPSYTELKEKRDPNLLSFKYVSGFEFSGSQLIYLCITMQTSYSFKSI